MIELKAVAEPLERFGVIEEKADMARKPANKSDNMYVCLCTIH